MQLNYLSLPSKGYFYFHSENDFFSEHHLMKKNFAQFNSSSTKLRKGLGIKINSAL